MFVYGKQGYFWDDQVLASVYYWWGLTDYANSDGVVFWSSLTELITKLVYMDLSVIRRKMDRFYIKSYREMIKCYTRAITHIQAELPSDYAHFLESEMPRIWNVPERYTGGMTGEESIQERMSPYVDKFTSITEEAFRMGRTKATFDSSAPIR